MRGLKGKVAVVAGAAPGNIGAATAARLAEEGAAVVEADLSEAAVQSVVDEILAHLNVRDAHPLHTQVDNTTVKSCPGVCIVA